MTFYSIVLIIAIILLIVILTCLGLLMKKGTTNDFPSYANSCPDNWSSDGSGNCTSNMKNIPKEYIIDKTYSSNSPGYINFYYNDGTFKTGATATQLPNSNMYVPSTLKINTNILKSVCDQKTWSTANNIQWDGVTNSNAKC
jgi:hypothetical protein